MKQRIELLRNLVSMDGNLSNIEKSLSEYPWDATEPLLMLTKDNLCTILKKHFYGEVDDYQLERWANLIECRDDLSFETEDVQEFIFEMANPEIHGTVTKERLNEMITQLSSDQYKT